jgi:hypothetical protein
VNPHQASPSSSTHSLSQSYPHLHTTTQPQLNFGYPILQHPTTHHHYNNNHVPSQDHSQSYSQHPTTVQDSMISSAPLELIPHRPENSMYSSSYMRSGRTLKLAAAEDETSSVLHQHHHHPAGIVNEYNPRGTAGNIYTSQHDTQGHGHHQYEVRFFFLRLGLHQVVLMFF